MLLVRVNFLVLVYYSTLVSTIIFANAAKIELMNVVSSGQQQMNTWLHHEMKPSELNHHFGVEFPQQVNPSLYQVIQIHTDDNHETGRTYNRSEILIYWA